MFLAYLIFCGAQNRNLSRLKQLFFRVTKQCYSTHTIRNRTKKHTHFFDNKK